MADLTEEQYHTIANVALNTVVEYIDSMIDEVFDQGRKMQAPLMGGGHQAVFDAEQLGAFIRYTVLHDVRARIKGEMPDTAQLRTEFQKRWRD